MKYLIYICLLLMSLIGCTERKTMSTLTLIDSLLEKDSMEEASAHLDALDVTNMSEEEKAYFYLLKTSYYKETNETCMSDSFINKSIAYYEQSSDKKKLVRAYCIRSYFLYDTEKAPEAIFQLKKAEELAEKEKDNKLLVQVYSCLSSYNLFSGNIRAALSYARKTKSHALLVGDKRWIGFSNLALFTIYYNMNRTDSADFYIKESLPYAKYQSLRVRPLFYNNIAVYYIEKKDLEKAKQYLHHSLSIFPHTHTYYLLAKIYSEEKEEEKADSFWHKALQEKDFRQRLDIMQEYSDWLTQQERYKEASEVSMQFIALKDSLSNVSEREGISEALHHYNKKRVEKMLWRYGRWVLLMLVFIAAAVFLLLKRHRSKVKRMRSEAADIHAQIVKYQQQLQELKSANHEYQQKLTDRQEKIISNQEKIELLEQKIEKLQNRQKEMFSKGKSLYDKLQSGESLILWKQSDMRNFIEFYQIQNYNLFEKLENKSESYSLNQKVYFILLDMGKSEEQIKQIMNLSEGALRTMRYRIRRKGGEDE